MRLIDAEKLEYALHNEAFKKDGENLKREDDGYWIPYRMFLRVLDMAPTMMAKIEFKEVEEKNND